MDHSHAPPTKAVYGRPVASAPYLRTIHDPFQAPQTVTDSPMAQQHPTAYGTEPLVADLPSNHDSSNLPIVIPQTNKAFRGAFFSPFLRVYPPALASADPPISKDEFVRFIDDLNEAFIGSPYLQAIGLAGAVTSFVPLAAAQIAGASISTASGFVSAATSYGRTRALVRSANETFFGPRGLQLRILSTKDMMAKIGRDGEKIQLARLSEDAATAESTIDPRVRWLAALEGSIAPLDWDVPEAAAQENWLKKPGAWQARRQEAKKTKELGKERTEARKDVKEARQEVTKRRRSMDKEIAKLHKEMLKVEDKAAREMRKKGDSVREAEKIEREKQKEIAKIQKEIDKETREFERENARGTRKIDKAMGEDKEQKKVQKIRWMVITPITAPVEDEEIDAGVEDAASE